MFGSGTYSGGFFNRALYAFNGFLSAWTSYNVASPEYAYDAYAARLWRYNQAIHYYSNTIYSIINRYAEIYKQQNLLYKHIRSIYNPVARIVDFYPGKVYGGNIDYEKLQHGAIPISMADAALRDALRQLMIWSNWGTQKALFVRYGAMFGDTAIKVVDDRDHARVRMEVLDPRKIKFIQRDDIGCIDKIIIEYMDYDENQRLLPNSDPTPKSYLYTEIIDNDQFQTFKDGKPFAYYEDDRGQEVAAWNNEYGFVPVVVAQHRNVGMDWGASAYHTSTGKIDEINDSASLLNDQIRKAVQTMWWAAGVNASTALTASTDKKDDVPMVFAPQGSQPYPMVAPIDISAAMKNIDQMLVELEADLCELSLHRLRDRGQLTAPGVTAGYSDAIDRIQEARANYDDALVRAMQMSVAIGGYNRYDNFTGFSLWQYQDETLDFHISDRPVIDDQLSELEKVQVLADTGAPRSAIWSRLGYDDDTVAKWVDIVGGDTGNIPKQPLSPITDKVTVNYPQPQSNQPAIRGAKLPPSEALKVNPITDQETTAIGAMHRQTMPNGAKA